MQVGKFTYPSDIAFFAILLAETDFPDLMQKQQRKFVRYRFHKT